MAATFSGSDAAPIGAHDGQYANGWNVCRPSNNVTGRPATCGRTLAPSARASAQSSSIRCQASGSWSFWVSANVTGRPIAADSLRIQAISRSGAARSSPSAPAGASSNTPVPSSPRTRPIPNSSSSAANVPGTGSPSIAMCAIVRLVEKPNAPGLHSFPHDARHRVDVFGSGGLVLGATLPHDVHAYCAVRHLGRDVEELGRRATASRYSGNVSHSHSMPADSAAPGMSSTPSMSPISQSRRSGCTGANPTPQLPMTIVVTPCQHVGREQRVPGDLPVEVRVHVDEARA